MEQIGVGHFKAEDKHKEYVLDALNRDRLSYGPYSIKFERTFAKIHGLKYATFCNSGTSALHMAIATLKETENWQDGDEILCPAVTFVASSNSIIMNNLKPVLVDVESNYYGIDPTKIEAKITSRTKAIMVVHLFGLPCDMDSIMEIARRRNLKVIEDSCETMFATYDGKPVGSFGDISCFSTYVAHIMVTGVGGFACTNNPKYAEILRSLMNHGRDNIYLTIDDDKGKEGQELKEIVKRRFNFVRLGFSFRATEMEAALGVAELESAEEMMRKRLTNAKFLYENLKKYNLFLQLPEVRPKANHVFMMFPIVLKNLTNKKEELLSVLEQNHQKSKSELLAVFEKNNLSNKNQLLENLENNYQKSKAEFLESLNESLIKTKEELVNFLEANHIETRDMVPLINQPFYKAMYGDLESEFPIADYINKNGFYIGCHPGLTQQELDYVVNKFAEFFCNTEAVIEKEVPKSYIDDYINSYEDDESGPLLGESEQEDVWHQSMQDRTIEPSF